jgi:hypothetical protein
MAEAKLDLAKDSTMTKAAQILATAVRKNAPHEGIRKSVRIGRREGRGTSKLITVLVGKVYIPGSGQQGSEYAAKAFDKGSGIHRKGGGTYTITAINSPNLVFFWNRMNKLFRGKSVQHPGVAGTGYMKKSRDEARPKIKALFAKEAKKETKFRLQAEFRNFGK